MKSDLNGERQPLDNKEEKPVLRTPEDYATSVKRLTEERKKRNAAITSKYKLIK